MVCVTNAVIHVLNSGIELNYKNIPPETLTTKFFLPTAGTEVKNKIKCRLSTET